MSGVGAIADRGGVWPVPLARFERTMLGVQAKDDRRNVPPLWLWRLLRADDDGGTAPDPAFAEVARSQRKYAPPVAVHLYVDWSAEAKAKKKPVTETTGVINIGYSRAEARRLGALLKLRDDAEGLLGDPVRADYIYIPRAGDLFRSRDRYCHVFQLKPEWKGATKLLERWTGTAHMIRDDAGNPGMPQLVQPATAEPLSSPDSPQAAFP